MRHLLAPGYACTPAIWKHAAEQLPDAELVFLEWPLTLTSKEEAADFLAAAVERSAPEVLVGHSMGGVLLLELLIEGRVAPRPTVLADAFIVDPAPMFRNLVWSDEALRAEVTAMLGALKPRLVALRASLEAWDTAGWPEAPLRTGARFVYGGRGASDTAVRAALGWPEGAAHADRVEIIPGASHFLMLESPAAFYAAVRRLVAAGARLSDTPAPGG